MHVGLLAVRHAESRSVVITFGPYYLELVDGAPVLAGLLHRLLGPDLGVVVGQLVDDGPLGGEVLKVGPHLAVLLHLAFHLGEKKRDDVLNGEEKNEENKFSDIQVTSVMS